MLFTNCRREQNVSIIINNCDIDNVYKTKLLGVAINSKFNWKDHIVRLRLNCQKA